MTNMYGSRISKNMIDEIVALLWCDKSGHHIFDNYNECILNKYIHPYHLNSMSIHTNNKISIPTI